MKNTDNININSINKIEANTTNHTQDFDRQLMDVLDNKVSSPYYNQSRIHTFENFRMEPNFSCNINNLVLKSDGKTLNTLYEKGLFAIYNNCINFKMRRFLIQFFSEQFFEKYKTKEDMVERQSQAFIDELGKNVLPVKNKIKQELLKLNSNEIEAELNKFIVSIKHIVKNEGVTISFPKNMPDDLITKINSKLTPQIKISKEEIDKVIIKTTPLSMII